MGTNFFDIKILNTRSFTTSNSQICQQKIKVFVRGPTLNCNTLRDKSMQLGRTNLA